MIGKDKDKSKTGGAELMEEDDPLRFDLVITDLKMPSMDGIELLRRLDATKAAPPALVLTSCADEDMRARALRVGAADCLTKPVEDNVLLHRIEAILREAGKTPPHRQ